MILSNIHIGEKAMKTVPRGQRPLIIVEFGVESQEGICSEKAAKACFAALLDNLYECV
jgi:hypothetical protein